MQRKLAVLALVVSLGVLTPGGKSAMTLADNSAPVAMPVAGGAPVAAPAAAPVAGAGNAAAAVGQKATAGAAKAGTAAAQAPTAKKPVPDQGFSLTSLILPVGLILILFFLMRAPKKEQKRREQMMASLKKGDRVVTTGGMVCSVVDVRDDDIVLKIDESNNVKARFLKTAVASVVPDDKAGDDSKN
ncbi:MAG: preprotein translocase subunit YajC [Phycisphaerales bacterium]|nr:preprotein translocase subunit YajC [Phycisphaerales bacterium]